MFDMVSAHHDSGRIPLADGFRFFVFGRRQQVVEGGQRAIAIAAQLGIRMPGIVQDLVFVANGGTDGRFGAGASDRRKIGMNSWTPI